MRRPMTLCLTTVLWTLALAPAAAALPDDFRFVHFDELARSPSPVRSAPRAAAQAAARAPADLQDAKRAACRHLSLDEPSCRRQCTPFGPRDGIFFEVLCETTQERIVAAGEVARTVCGAMVLVAPATGAVLPSVEWQATRDERRTLRTSDAFVCSERRIPAPAPGEGWSPIPF